MAFARFASLEDADYIMIDYIMVMNRFDRYYE